MCDCNVSSEAMFLTCLHFLPQDTVIALQALANYAAISGANAIDLRLSISDPASSFAAVFHINSSNFEAYQSREVTDHSLSLMPKLAISKIQLITLQK